MTITTYKCQKCGRIQEVLTEYVEMDGVPICIDCTVEMEEVTD